MPGGAGAGAGERTKALQATTSDGDGVLTRPASVPPVAQQQPPEPEPLPAVGTVADSADDASPVLQSKSCGEDAGEDDDQVERFYALLANIRVLRGLYSAGDGGGSGSAAAGRGRKRTREAEAPWKPVFRLEDFEQEVNQGTASAPRAAMNQLGTSGGVASRPAGRADDDHGSGGARIRNYHISA